MSKKALTIKDLHMPFNYTSKVMDAIAKAFYNNSYEPFGKRYKKTWYKQIGNVRAKTNKELSHKLWPLLESGLCSDDAVNTLLKAKDY